MIAIAATFAAERATRWEIVERIANHRRGPDEAATRRECAYAVLDEAGPLIAKRVGEAVASRCLDGVCANWRFDPKDIEWEP
jgi:hypothetical protein